MFYSPKNVTVPLFLNYLNLCEFFRFAAVAGAAKMGRPGAGAAKMGRPGAEAAKKGGGSATLASVNLIYRISTLLQIQT